MGSLKNLGPAPGADALLAVSGLAMLIGLFIAAFADPSQIDVEIFRMAMPLVAVASVGQFVAAIFMYRGRLWGLVGVTIFFLLALAAQTIQSITHSDNIAVYIPHLLPLLLLLILWTRSRSYFK